MSATLQDDLLAEYIELHDICASFTLQEWETPGPFHNWTPWDEVAHLCYFDEAALDAVHAAEKFQREAAALVVRTATGEPISQIARSHFAGMDGPTLLALWRERFTALVQGMAALDPKSRLPWYGPSMSARSFATARLMETWAHGQDVWDTVRRRRPGSERLRHIAHLGVNTFAWTFVNRGMPVPEPVPSVELLAPDGTRWRWGAPESAERVQGPAEDFCLVVTQRRHVSDTQLQVSAGSARQWMEIAQCFAGEPADGPAPGVRRLDGI